jgi:UDP-N-acetylmuramoylalanine--D-glutamate ligase
VVWIVGGLLKGVDIGQLVSEHAHRLRGVVVIGAERDDVLTALERHAPDVPRIEISDDAEARETVEAGRAGEVMTRAVQAAASLATEGDTVLLAPAAASMDQFKDYPDRGRQFQAAVRELE